MKKNFLRFFWWKDLTIPLRTRISRTRLTFLKFDQTKMFQILLYTLPNIFDSANLIKLVWPCIGGDSWLFDWFNQFSMVDWFKTNCVNFFFLKTYIWFCRMQNLLLKLVFRSILLSFLRHPILLFLRTMF